MVLKHGVFLLITLAANSLFAANLFSTNSGFETAITPWKLSFNDTLKANAKATQDTVGVKFGKKYLKVTITKVEADSAAAHNWYIQLWEPTWTNKKNVKYYYSCWAKSGDSISHPFDIAATGDSASEYTYRAEGSGGFTATQDWQLFQVSYTWTDAGTTTKHFRLFLGASKGAICFDSMVLDTIPPLITAVTEPLTISNRTAASDYGVLLLPNSLRIIMDNSTSMSNKVAIYSISGRLQSSQTFPATVSTFNLPNPGSGAWIVDVNSNKKLIRNP